jgi:MFS family permease
MLLPVLFFGVLMGALDIAIVGPALPAIGADFGVDEGGLAWVFSIFTLFAVIGAAPLARLSDRFGRRSLYIASVSVFTIGSLLVAIAPSFELLLAARAIQALGAGGIFPVASAVIGDVVPESRRGRALGLIGAVFGLAFLLGPVLGGLLLPYGWRSLFLINLPIGALLIAAATRVLPGAARTVTGRIDVSGIVLLACVLGLLAIAFNGLAGLPGGDLRAYARVFVPLLAGVFLAVLLRRVERAAEDPVLPPAMFASRQLRVIGAISVVAGLVEAGMVFLPTVAVSGLAVTESNASWMMLPLVMALAVAAPLAGVAVDRWSSRVVIRAGLVLLVAGLLAFALLPLTVTNFYLAGCIVGAGLASLLGAPLRHAALAATPGAQRGIGQGLMSLTLQTGQILGAAAIGAIMAAQPATQGGFRSAMLLLAFIAGIAAVVSARLRAGS